MWKKSHELRKYYSLLVFFVLTGCASMELSSVFKTVATSLVTKPIIEHVTIETQPLASDEEKRVEFQLTEKTTVKERKDQTFAIIKMVLFISLGLVSIFIVGHLLKL